MPCLNGGPKGPKVDQNVSTSEQLGYRTGQRRVRDSSLTLATGCVICVFTGQEFRSALTLVPVIEEYGDDLLISQFFPSFLRKVYPARAAFHASCSLRACSYPSAA
jgi:hypothetical protein